MKVFQNPFSRNQTQYRSEMEALGEKVAILEMVLEASAQGLLVTDCSGSIVYFNGPLIRLWNFPEDVLLQGKLNWQVLFSNQLKEPERLLQFVHQVKDQPVVESLGIFELNGGKLLECRSRLHTLGKNQTAYHVWNFFDCTEQQRRERELHHLSTHDTLTGMHNRAYFEMMLRECRALKKYPVSMIMVDIDGLKKVNDQLGHPAGDILLRQAGNILRQACRAGDVVARLGGDEFGLLLINADQSVSDQVLNRIYGLSNLYNIRHPSEPLSLSLGSAVAYCQEEVDNLFLRADESMYQSRWKRRSGSI
jgi:diguanylate cyclase (GGDEF)-like protein